MLGKFVDQRAESQRVLNLLNLLFLQAAVVPSQHQLHLSGHLSAIHDVFELHFLFQDCFDEFPIDLPYYSMHLHHQQQLALQTVLLQCLDEPENDLLPPLLLVLPLVHLGDVDLDLEMLSLRDELPRLDLVALFY